MPAEIAAQFPEQPLDAVSAKEIGRTRRPGQV
jgi:hypothetical protein